MFILLKVHNGWCCQFLCLKIQALVCSCLDLLDGLLFAVVHAPQGVRPFVKFTKTAAIVSHDMEGGVPRGCSLVALMETCYTHWKIYGFRNFEKQKCRFRKFFVLGAYSGIEVSLPEARSALRHRCDPFRSYGYLGRSDRRQKAKPRRYRSVRSA